MDDIALRIGAAAAGGYLLGRTKKAKAAIGLALWLTGRRRPRDIARDQVVKLLNSDQAHDLIDQVRGPVLSAGRQAAVSALEGQAERLSDNLASRTEQLSGAVAGGGRKTGAAGNETTRRLTSRRRRGADVDDEDWEEEPADEEGTAPEYEDDSEYDEADEEELEPARSASRARGSRSARDSSSRSSEARPARGRASGRRSPERPTRSRTRTSA